MSERVERPTRFGSAVAIVAALGAAVLVASGSGVAAVLGSAGVVVLAVGLTRGHRTAIDIGAVVLFLAVVVGALGAVSVGPTVLATVGVVVAWDVGHRSTGLGEQLGAGADTARLEVAHVASSLLIGLGSALVAVTAFAVTTGGLPVGAVILLVLAGAFLVVGLGRPEDVPGITDFRGE